MALAYTIDPSARLVHLIEDSLPSFEEYRQTILAVLDDPNFVKGYHFLCDIRSVDRAPTTDNVRNAVSLTYSIRERTGDCKWAIVIGTNKLHRAARMIQILGENRGLQVRVFWDIDKAGQWLNA